MARPPVAPEIRFWAKVQKTDRCWLWTAGVDKDGYGRFGAGYNTEGRYLMVRAHVWAWKQENGPVPEGLVLDHVVCDTPGCVRPSHLRPTTNRENVLRGTGPAAKNARKVVCIRGHSEWVQTKRGRYCRPCRLAKMPEYNRTQARRQQNVLG